MTTATFCYECDTALVKYCPHCNPPASASPAPPEEEVERVARAIDKARCPGREGPFGGYDYGHNRTPPEGGRYVIRDFRDPSSPDYGKWVHQTDDQALHDATFERMTRHSIASAAISALRPAPKLTEEERARVEEVRSRVEWWKENDGPFRTMPMSTAIEALEEALSLIDKLTEAG